MVFEDVDSDDSLCKNRIGGSDEIIISMFVVFQSIQTFADEFKECFEVLR